MKPFINWQQSPIGKAIIQAESTFLLKQVKNLSGSQLLWLGELAATAKLAQINYDKTTILTRNINSDQTAEQNQKEYVQGQYEDMPILTDSINLLIAPHSLDFSNDQKSMIKEMWRVLAPGGKVILFGFSSNSLWGYPKILKAQNHSGHFLLPTRLRVLCLTTGFTVEQSTTFYFQPLLNTTNGIRRMQFIEFIGNLCWPSFGCVYMFVLKKSIIPVNPIIEKQFKWRSTHLKGVAEPATRSQYER